MQSSNTSKKTRTKAKEETVAASAENSTASAEVKSNSRASKSSPTKKQASETGRAKHRNPNPAEPPPTQSRAMDSPVIDPVGVMTPSPETREVSHSHVANLAYSYWIARGYAHGFAEEDWHRAERELQEKR